MKVTIQRASDWTDEKQPCDGAELVEVESKDDGYVASGGWYPAWVVEFDLESFVAAHGPVVVDVSRAHGYAFHVKIYDDYLE